MGEIIQEAHIYAGGVETHYRKNELIVILDCHDEEGLGVYTHDGFSDEASYTTSFGYGPLAEVMAEAFFRATVRFHEAVLRPYDASLDLEKSKELWDKINEEWRDDWLKITHKQDADGNILPEVDEANTDITQLPKLLAFIAKWDCEPIEDETLTK